jgi:hypothetical protein
VIDIDGYRLRAGRAWYRGLAHILSLPQKQTAKTETSRGRVRYFNPLHCAALAATAALAYGDAHLIQAWLQLQLLIPYHRTLPGSRLRDNGQQLLETSELAAVVNGRAEHINFRFPGPVCRVEVQGLPVDLHGNL